MTAQTAREDEDYVIRAEVGECTAAGDHEVVFERCIHCGAEFPEDDDE